MKVQKIQKRIPNSHKAWYEIDGRSFYFKSKWEVQFAEYLTFLKKNKSIKDWEYESKTFWFESIKRGTRSYLPDFKVIKEDGSHYWAEVKGYLDPRSKTKLRRFAKYYPREELFVFNGEWFKKNKEKIPQKEARKIVAQDESSISNRD